MTVGSLHASERRAQLRGTGLRLRVGPFLVRLRTSVEAVEQAIATLYAAHPLEPPGWGGHFDIRVGPPSLLRTFVRRQVQFEADGQTPFIPLPVGMAALMFEAGLNWCIGAAANHLIVIHSATLERDGIGLLMPAPPGSGKSTLCAALVARGWRLLSDEFALIDPSTGMLVPVPRPISLKDGSIDVIRSWWDDAQFSPAVRNNEGQLVSYLKAPDASVRDSAITSTPRLVVVPRFRAGAAASVVPMSRARTVLHLADSSFNYNLQGRRGFECLVAIADRSPAVTLEYSALVDGVKAVDSLASAGRG